MDDTPAGTEGADNETPADAPLDSALNEAWNPEWDDEEVSLTPDSDEYEDDGDEPDASDEAPEDDTDTYSVTIDGEEVSVTLKDLLGGYTRQADYTRKTQALAEEREKYAAFEALSSALRDNPQDTLTKLSRFYGVDLAGVEDTPDPLEDLDPELANEIRGMREFRQMFQQDQATRAAAEQAQRVDAEIESVRTKFNDPDLDEGELLQFAIKNQIGTLDAAYKAMAWEQKAADKSAATEKVVERKRKAPPVEGGRNRSNGTVKGSSAKSSSVAEAFEAALQSLS